MFCIKGIVTCCFSNILSVYHCPSNVYQKVSTEKSTPVSQGRSVSKGFPVAMKNALFACGCHCWVILPVKHCLCSTPTLYYNWENGRGEVGVGRRGKGVRRSVYEVGRRGEGALFRLACVWWCHKTQASQNHLFEPQSHKNPDHKKTTECFKFNFCVWNWGQKLPQNTKKIEIFFLNLWIN